MKIAILGFTKIKYMPYLHFYLNQIDTANDEVHLIYWERDKNEDVAVPSNVIAHPFKRDMSDALPLRKKLPCFLGYRKFAKKALREINPDFLIILHSTTGITILDLLKKKYKKKYILDFRDVTYERNPIYRKAVASLVKNAALTFTSSDGFRKFLPEDAEILTSHNLTRDVLEGRERFRTREKSEKIRVAFWGLLRHQSINEQIIKHLGNNPNFEIHYYGRAQGKMLELMENSVNSYSNVFFHGEYSSIDRLEFANQTDVLHNLYDNSDKTTPIAMGNKYYDGIVFYIPQICMPGSLMSNMSNRAGVGFSYDPYSETFADDIYKYYNSLDRDAFISACDTELARVLNEVEIGERRIKEVLKNAKA